MSVSRAEVDTFRREAQAAQRSDVVERTPLESLAEDIGYLVYRWRQLGADQAAVLHDIELLVRSTDQDREDIREARDVLAKLGYGRDVTMLLTRLARKAKPKQEYQPGRGRDRPRSRAVAVR